MIFSVKNVPKIKLIDLLRKRKLTLHKFVTDAGISCYTSLLERCHTLGVLPPTEVEYTSLFPITVTSQDDGIIIVGEHVDLDVIRIENEPTEIESLETALEEHDATIDDRKKKKKRREE